MKFYYARKKSYVPLESIKIIQEISNENKQNLTLLPPDILTNIFSYLNESDLAKMAIVNKQLGQLSKQNGLWKKFAIHLLMDIAVDYPPLEADLPKLLKNITDLSSEAATMINEHYLETLHVLRGGLSLRKGRPPEKYYAINFDCKCKCGDSIFMEITTQFIFFAIAASIALIPTFITSSLKSGNPGQAYVITFLSIFLLANMANRHESITNNVATLFQAIANIFIAIKNCQTAPANSLAERYENKLLNIEQYVMTPWRENQLKKIIASRGMRFKFFNEQAPDYNEYKETINKINNSIK